MPRIKDQLAELSHKIGAQTTVINSVKTLVEGLRQSLATASGELSAADEDEAAAKLDEVLAAFDANAQALIDATIDNTPAQGEGGGA